VRPPRWGCAAEEPGDRITNQASAGRVRVAVGDEQVPQQLAEPASVLGDGVAHRVDGVGIVGRGVDEGAASVAGIAAEFADAVEDGQHHVARRRLGEPRGGRPLSLALLLHVGADEVVLGGEVVVEGRLGHAGLGDDPVDADRMPTRGDAPSFVDKWSRVWRGRDSDPDLYMVNPPSAETREDLPSIVAALLAIEPDVRVVPPDGPRRPTVS
jgi:hypothetical protein